MDVRKTYKLYVGGEFVRSESGRAHRVRDVNVPRASRKDLRDAVRVARGACGGWSRRTAMNRGQVLYRAAEMLDSRRSQFTTLLGGGQPARRELDGCVDAWVWYAGCADKLAQVAGTVNPVAGPYFNFTIPEPTGVVGILAPEPPLLGLVSRLAPVLVGGNTAVVVASEAHPLVAIELAECLATADVPPGVVNVITGLRRELAPQLASHMDVVALDVTGADGDLAELERLGAENVKRIVRGKADGQSPYEIAAFLELKTVWHPIGM